MSNWISVKDELPKGGEYVLIYENGTIQVASLLHISTGVNPFVTTNCECCGCVKEFFDVTHWQPLPEPPKE